MVFINFIILVAVLVGMWKVFTKAGEYGWASLIPFYNLWVLNRIGGKEWYWFIGMFIPLINLVVFILLSLAIARRFGQPSVFGVGLFLLPFIFYPILGFGSARFVGGPTAAASNSEPEIR